MTDRTGDWVDALRAALSTPANYEERSSRAREGDP
jgi:hypothetical protein